MAQQYLAAGEMTGRFCTRKLCDRKMRPCGALSDLQVEKGIPTMFKPDEVAERGRQKQDENLRFRTYLKTHADTVILDAQFKALHEELFSQYDCSTCRNCCKMFSGLIPEDEIERDASFLGISRDEFIDEYLANEKNEGMYVTKNFPCNFLDESSGNCILEDHKPENCAKYPYTDQPDRMGSLFSIIESAEVCPVVYEILERLKEEYQFGARVRKKVYPNEPCPCGSGKKYKNCCGRK